jgi:hypothetical protein
MIMENLFISESSFGYHYNEAIKKTMKADFLSFTFYPVIATKIFKDINDVYIKYGNKVLYNFENIIYKIEYGFNGDIVDFILSLKKKHIFIGFDLDEMGELMASVLNYKLIANGFNPENIIRVPLTSFGYDFTEIGFSEFYSYDTLERILKFIHKEKDLIRLTGQGFRKNFIIKELILLNDKEFERLNENTNTVTYVTKYLLNERK